MRYGPHPKPAEAIQSDKDATIAALRNALREACDMLMMQPERRAELQALGWSEPSRVAYLRKLADGGS